MHRPWRSRHAHRSSNGREPTSKCSFLALLPALSLVLLACASRDGHQPMLAARAAAASPTLAVATQAAQSSEPITIAVSVNEPGSIANQSATLTVSVTVTNRTTTSAHIYRTPCYGPFISLRMQDAAGRGTGELNSNDPCLLGQPPVDLEPGIPAASQQAYSIQVGLATYHTLVPGTYTMFVRVAWHQGTLDQLAAGASGLLHGTADGQVTFRLR